MTETNQVRIMAAGSKEWTEESAVLSAISGAVIRRGKTGLNDMSVIHSSEDTGVAKIVRDAAELYGFDTEEHLTPDIEGGYMARNQGMVDDGADEVIVFMLSSSEDSSDENDLIDRAEEAGLKVTIIERGFKG